MVDFECKLKFLRATWVPKLINENSDWAFFGNRYLHLLGSNNLVLHYNFIQAKQFPLLKNIPIFYQKVVLAHNETKIVTVPDNSEKLLDEILWGNIMFTYYNLSTKDQETLFFKNWISSGFVHLRSLKFINGNIEETYIYNKTSDKRNIYCEILVIKNAILPYKTILAEYTSTPEDITFNVNIMSNRECELQKITSKQAHRNLAQKNLNNLFSTRYGIDYSKLKILISNMSTCTKSK